MSKSDKNAVRKTESVVPKSIRRAEMQTEKALRGLTRGYIEQVWDDAEELDEIETRSHLNHKQTLR